MKPTNPNKELTKLRRTLGLSKTELAAMLGVFRHTIRRWETGKTPTPYHVMQELTELVRRFEPTTGKGKV